MTRATSEITARMLLSHTSGFPNWRWLNDDRKLNISFEPGSRYAYSGEGIDLLQLVVETITNKPVQELMRTHIFEPFGMTRSSMVWESRFESDAANAYDEWGRSLWATWAVETRCRRFAADNRRRLCPIPAGRDAR